MASHLSGPTIEPELWSGVCIKSVYHAFFNECKHKRGIFIRIYQRGLILWLWHSSFLLSQLTFRFRNLGTTTPHSRKSEPRPSQFRPPTTEAIARKQSFSSPSRGAPTSLRTWRSSMKSVLRTKRLPTSFRKSPRTRKPTEFEIQTPRCIAFSL